MIVIHDPSKVDLNCSSSPPAQQGMTSGHHLVTNNPHQQQHFGNTNNTNMANLTVVNDPRQLHENIRHAKEASIQVSVRPLHRTILGKGFMKGKDFFLIISSGSTKLRNKKV